MRNQSCTMHCRHTYLTALALLNEYGVQAPWLAGERAAEMRHAGCKAGEREWLAVCDAVIELACTSEGQSIH